MKFFLTTLILLCLSLVTEAQDNNITLMNQLIKSEQTRHPIAWTIDATKGPKWNYTQGLELLAMQRCNKTDITRYIQSYVDTLINEEGTIRGYKMADYKLDAINSGKLLFHLYKKTRKQKYLTAMQTLRKQLETQPRTPQGGFWHKRIYPEQMWLDGVYMSAPFLAEYAMKFERGSKRDSTINDIIHQFTLIYQQTYCRECRLCHHAWDAACAQPWCLSTLEGRTGDGRSSHAWGRAEGWYLMALVDVIDILGNSRTEELQGILQSLCFRMLELQNVQTGCWQQVLDRTGDKGNYDETSVTAMTAYAMLKGVRLGILDRGLFRSSARRALTGLRNNHISTDKDGLLTLHNTCNVAGLSSDRLGTYDYYLSERIGNNDPKALGPLMLALKEDTQIK